MYSLIIADDEKRIRDGFLRVVNWSALGYEVVGCYADGAEILAHMERSPADVVLTDICMPSVSGLDVARELQAKYPQTVCVLVSGFQEFDFARQALAFGVVEYLLKPTRLTELERVFRHVASTLDGARHARHREETRNHELARMSEDMRRQFLLDLYMGTIKQPEMLNARLSRFFPQHLHAAGVLLVSWRIQRPEQSDALASEHGANSTDHALDTLFRTQQDGLSMDPVVIEPQRLVILVLMAREQEDALRCQAADTIAAVVEQAESILEIAFLRREEAWFESLQAFSARQKPLLRAASEGDMRLDEDSMHAILEQERILLSYLAGGEAQQANVLLDDLVSQLQALPLTLVKSVLVDIFARIREQLRTLRMLPADAPLLRYDTLMAAISIAQVHSWYQEQLRDWQSRLKGQPQTRRVIALIRQYVETEYMNSPSLERAAERVFLSAVYVSRLFKQETGQTLTEYILQVRMQAAQQYLLKSDLKVYEIGQRVGYDNARYFYRAFKAYAGMTPNEYRQRMSTSPPWPAGQQVDFSGNPNGEGTEAP